MSITNGTFPGVRIVDMPDLGTVTDTTSVVAEKAGSGRISALAFKSYVGTSFLPIAGGTVTGNLTVNGALQAGGGFTGLTGMTATQVLAPQIGAPYLLINLYSKGPGGSSSLGSLSGGVGNGVWAGINTGVRLSVGMPQAAGTDVPLGQNFDFGADGTLLLNNSLRVIATDSSIVAKTGGGYVSITGGTQVLQANARRPGPERWRPLNGG